MYGTARTAGPARDCGFPHTSIVVQIFWKVKSRLLFVFQFGKRDLFLPEVRLWFSLCLSLSIHICVYVCVCIHMYVCIHICTGRVLDRVYRLAMNHRVCYDIGHFRPIWPTAGLFGENDLLSFPLALTLPRNFPKTFPAPLSVQIQNRLPFEFLNLYHCFGAFGACCFSPLLGPARC